MRMEMVFAEWRGTGMLVSLKFPVFADVSHFVAMLGLLLAGVYCSVSFSVDLVRLIMRPSRY